MRRSIALLGAALLAIATVALPASADTFVPTSGAVGPTSLVGFVDTPSSGGQVPARGFLAVTGWVVDPSAQGWSGVNTLEVYDGAIEAGGRLLGSGSASQSRPDVAQTMGYPYWANSGFSVGINTDDLSWGPRTLHLYAVTGDRGRWLLALNVSKVAQSPSGADKFPTDPEIRMLDPLPASIVRSAPAIMRGLAFDRNTASGTGVDRVEVYVGPREAGGRFVGAGALSKGYGEIGFEYKDSRFDESGWDLVWDPRQYGNGDRDLYVYARRAGTDIWNVQRLRIIIAV
jgi:hypothetical protein